MTKTNDTVEAYAADPTAHYSEINQTLGWVCRAMRNLEYPDADIVLMLVEFDRITPKGLC